MQAQSKNQIDTVEIVRALQVILEPGQVAELRALEATTPDYRRPRTISGYFDDPAKLAEAATRIERAKGIYFTPNRILPALLARAANHTKDIGRDSLTSDLDVVRRRWLLVDCDPKRPADISSSNAEHEAAIERARQIREALAAQGWPTPILADSGNGAHLLYRVDLPPNDGGLIQRCLAALAFRFGDEMVSVDQSVFNPARIWKVYGTWACKGDDMPERPHRRARLLDVPDERCVVSAELLNALAASLPTEDVSTRLTPTRQHSGVSRSSFDLDAWVREYCPDAKGPLPWGPDRKWVLPVCPWNEAHRNQSAYIVQFANGAIGAGCLHDSCAGKRWPDLRDMKEPGSRDRPHASSPQLTLAPSSKAADESVEPVLVRLSDVTRREVRWLWPNRFALGKLNLIFGDPGKGKSFITLDMAARVSAGKAWPDDSGNAPLGTVILLNCEDELDDTIGPRLDRAGADSTKVVALQAVQCTNKDGGKKERCFTLDDIAALEDAVKAHPDARLLIIDPVSAYLSDADSHNNAEVRGLLAPLAKLASDYELAVVMVTHMNKAGGNQVQYRAMGSMAFVAAVRSAWVVVAESEQSERRFLVPVKNNNGNDKSGLAYSIVDGVVEWEKEPVTTPASELLAATTEPLPPGPKPDRRDEAVRWLKALLARGPMPAGSEEQPEPGTIVRAARDADHSWSTIRRAKEELGIVAYRDPSSGRSYWHLPPQIGQHPDAQDIQTPAEPEQLEQPERLGGPDGSTPANMTKMLKSPSCSSPPSLSNLSSAAAFEEGDL